MTCVHRVKWSVKRPEDCRFRLSVSHYKDRIVAPDEYSGVTVVTPSDDTQTLPTKDKLVRDDITIFPAPEPDLRPLSVSENGSYQPDGFDGYSDVTVDVEPNLTSLSVTENGLYLPESGVDGFDRVSVNVPAPEPVTEQLSVTENGIYEPESGVDGYSRVTVDVPPTIPDLIPLTATANGQYVPTGHDGYSQVSVAVPIQEPVTEPLSVTQNGTYTPESGVDGFDEVVVAVPTGEETWDGTLYPITDETDPIYDSKPFDAHWVQLSAGDTIIIEGYGRGRWVGFRGITTVNISSLPSTVNIAVRPQPAGQFDYLRLKFEATEDCIAVLASSNGSREGTHSGQVAYCFCGDYLRWKVIHAS